MSEARTTQMRTDRIRLMGGPFDGCLLLDVVTNEHLTLHPGTTHLEIVPSWTDSHSVTYMLDGFSAWHVDPLEENHG